MGAREVDGYDIRLTPAPQITGMVTDARGHAVQGYMLQATSGQGGPLAIATSSAEGRFVLSANQNGSGALVMLQEWRCNGHGLLVDRPLHHWGDRDVHLIVKDPGVLDLRVRDQGHALPANTYGVSLLHHQHQDLQGWKGQRQFRAAEGEDVQRIPVIPGTVSLIVVPDAPDLQPSSVFTVEVSEGKAIAVDVQLERGLTVRVHARDRTTGAPVSGVLATIELRSAGNPEGEDGTVPFVRETVGLRALSWRSEGVLAKGTTGPDGIAVLRRPLAWQGASIHCRHSDYRAWSGKVLGDAEVHAELERANLLRGTLAPPAILALRPSLRAVTESAGKQVRTPWTTVDTQSGAFELVYEGEASVKLDLALNLDGSGPILTGVGIREVLAVEAATHRAPNGMALVVDAAAFLPGALLGTAFIDGQPARSVRVHRVEPNGAASAGWAAEIPVARDGTFQRDPMMVGEWMLMAMPQLEAGKLAALPLFLGRASVRARQTCSVAGDVRLVQTELCVVDGNSNPLDVGQTVLVAVASCPDRQMSFTLADAGLLRLGALPRDETVIAQVAGGRCDKMHGKAVVGAKRLTVR